MQDFSWFPYSIAATTSLGISVALYKLPTMRNQSKLVTAFWAQIVPGILALIFFRNYLHFTSGDMIFWAAVWGTAFGLQSLLQIISLKYVDTNVLFPAVSALALVLTIIFGLIFLHDNISLLQIIGMALVVIAVFLFFNKKTGLGLTRNMLIMGITLVFISVFNKIVQKFIAVSFDIHAFQVYQYFFASAISLIVAGIQHKKLLPQHFNKTVLLDGLMIGAFSFIGGYMLLLALSRGPISLVNTVHSIYILPTAIVGYFLFKEQLTKRRIFLLGLTIVALVLIRIG